MILIILFNIDTIPVGFSGLFSLIRKCAINFYVFYRWCKPTKQMCMQLEILLNSHTSVLKTKMLTSSIGRWHMHMVHKFDFLQKSLCMNIECATNYMSWLLGMVISYFILFRQNSSSWNSWQRWTNQKCSVFLDSAIQKEHSLHRYINDICTCIFSVGYCTQIEFTNKMFLQL